MMKKYALYPGCVMSTEQYAYELSLRAVLPKLDIELVDLNGFSCCGEPLKSVNQMLTLALSARNLAIAEKEKLDVFAPCPVCHLAFSECKKIVDSDPAMNEKVNAFLKDEELHYMGTAEVVTTLDLLHDIVGVETITKLVKKPLKEMKVATHYGCHLIRPTEIGRVDDAENPQKMETILKAIGAEPMDYPEKLDCCGGLLTANHPESALTKTGQKLQKVQEQNFDAFIDICPWCHRQYDSKQKKAGETVAAKLEVPVLYLTQLLGLSFGIPKDKLGLDLNLSPVNKLAMVGEG
ncbi:MAG: CoB--CoM heterodisulfide reductase iron-sulfur subunit B family protein [Candidatus Thermoplasmatota archaeon]|nr:CoB--CoM heterodisulfide reductase iron-sulfur subunit B family protein [Candidatus Thermoplasmatota archaeon]